MWESMATEPGAPVVASSKETILGINQIKEVPASSFQPRFQMLPVRTVPFPDFVNTLGPSEGSIRKGGAGFWLELTTTVRLSRKLSYAKTIVKRSGAEPVSVGPWEKPKLPIGMYRESLENPGESMNLRGSALMSVISEVYFTWNSEWQHCWFHCVFTCVIPRMWSVFHKRFSHKLWKERFAICATGLLCRRYRC